MVEAYQHTLGYTTLNLKYLKRGGVVCRLPTASGSEAATSFVTLITESMNTLPFPSTIACSSLPVSRLKWTMVLKEMSL